MKIGKALSAVIICLLSVNASVQADVTSDRIKGVSEFLLDRAQDNYFYLFEQNIKENCLFQFYFPNTYQYAASGDLKLLLTAGNELWEDSVRADIKEIMAKQALLLIGKIGVKIALNLTDRFIEVAKKIEINIGGQYYPIDRIPLNASQEVKDAINQFYMHFLPARDALLELHKTIEQWAGKCDIRGVSLEDVNKAVDQLRGAADAFGQSLKDIESRGYEIKVLGKITIDRVRVNAIQQFDAEMARIQQYRKRLEAVRNSSKSLLRKVIDTERIIREGIENGINPLDLKLQSREYQHFKRYILFFAQLSEAESSEQVKALLKEVTLPAVSFGIKRQPQEFHLMISAYLGYSAGAESVPDDSEYEKSFSGLVAPLGLEYSYGLRSGASLSIMVAPFDFGHPINLEWQDKEESVEFSDIVVPGVYFSYGLSKTPITFGIGYSRGRALRTESDSEGRIMAFVAFDMPLFQLY